MRVRWVERIPLVQTVRARSVQAYAFALFVVAVAAFFRWLLGLIAPGVSAMATFYPAILLAALIGGRAPGIVAATVGGAIGLLTFLVPSRSVLLASGTGIEFGLYALVSLLIVWGADHHRGLREQLENERALLKLTMEELTHRLRNKVATIQSIISFQLREHPAPRKEILGRLSALSATDQLILAARGKGARLREIVASELGPYEVDRAEAHGLDLLLPPRLALTIAMVVHELAANAAKYGALSANTGHISIRWKVVNGVLEIEWRESGGPTVTPPTRHGFGTRLVPAALGQFKGTAIVDFEPQGVRWKFHVPLTGVAETASEKRREAQIRV
jgi:two-component sensor histidine kinase